MGLGDKADALALAEQAMAVNPDRERRGDWSCVDRVLRPGGSAHGRTRSRHRCLTETISIPYYGGLGFGRAAYSRVAPARSDVRSAPK